MKHLPARFPLFAAIATALVIGALPVGAAARQPSPLLAGASNVLQAAPADGDLTWQLANRGMFRDQRVRMAFALLVDEAAVMTAAGLDGQPLVYGDQELRETLLNVPLEDAELLLAASGIATPGEPAQLQQTRVCQIWTPTDAAGLQQRQAVVTALAAELVRVFANLGVVIDPCQVTASAADADLIVSAIGLDGGPSTTVDLNLEGFLGQLVAPSAGAPGPANGGGVGSPQPGRGGNAGLLTPGDASNRTPAAVGLLLAVALVLFCRSALDRSVPRT